MILALEIFENSTEGLSLPEVTSVLHPMRRVGELRLT